MRLIKKDRSSGHDQAFQKRTHLYLNKIYHDIHFSDEEDDSLNEKIFKKFKKIESKWITNEKNNCLNKYDCARMVNNPLIVEEALKCHAVFNHPLFDFLMNKANGDDLRKFILNESILNLEFFDYLALSIVGVSEGVKSEIASNLWDEAGRGNNERFHTTLFEKMMKDLGLRYDRKQIIENMSWQGIAGINLFNYLSIYSFNKIKYFGLLAATEMLDPPHYHKLIKGILRIFKSDKINYSYYKEHEIVDVQHANGWLKNVVIPELSQKPNKTEDFWLGFYMRLNSAKEYYDNLLKIFAIKCAA